ncbi:hypothetical protein M501DRAFT_604730 [Patellaria atrata CBS 101060]|uniref:Uncharacterized protein n=1 Tax=Patellaria atrata CBS 101060 TaxID=1346257 RepID=A0A9P4S148_9PEZI|nr:hypothetical protein M501DRAFT_604730 [Patellaria atrata CBS 101060]
MLHAFSGENTTTRLNFLDIENRTKLQFSPAPIIKADLGNRLELKLNAHNHSNVGKTASTWEQRPLKEFFLLSQRYAVSPIHVDTGGPVTWVRILRGKKIWYFPRYISSETTCRLGQVGSLVPEDYPGGWSKIQLTRGDIMS